MRLLYFLIITSVCILHGIVAWTQPVTIHTAKKIAGNHFISIAGKGLIPKPQNGRDFRFTPASYTAHGRDTLYYVLNDSVNNCFAIVSADKRCWPVLGYSADGIFQIENQSPAFTAWMEDRKQEIIRSRKNNLKPGRKIISQWEMLDTTGSMLPESVSAVEPLLRTTWNQGCYYNTLCPSDAAGPCGHVWTGCVATSMAQIMKYWNYPTTGSGSHSYTHSKYGNLSANFGTTTYHWDQMPENLVSHNDAVATLMLHCGVSVDMNYGTSGSSAGMSAGALINYFKYSPDARYVSKKNYAAPDWNDLLRAELDAYRPVWYRGSSPTSGHAFVCDGYQGTEYFHFNWGWGGHEDGYYYLGEIEYNSNQGAVIKIFPSDLPDGFKGFFLSQNTLFLGAGAETDSVRISSSVAWTATSNQSWLSVNPGSGIKGDAYIRFSATENNSGSIRMAIATVSATGFKNQIITVTQYPKINVTAGNLKTILADKLSTTVSLTLTGTIDARDFKTMRDEMPVLTRINLGSAMIAAYSGSEGTFSASYYNYFANMIPDRAFYNNTTGSPKTGLTSFKFNNSVTAIGSSAFFNCTGLTTCSLPNSVISVGTQAFSYTTGLKTLYLPASLTTLGSFVFYRSHIAVTVDENNPAYSAVDGILFNKMKTTLIYVPDIITGNYSIPATVTTVSSYSFYNCSGLKSISVPSGLISIGGSAFYNCTGLSSLYSYPFNPINLGSVLNVFTGIDKNACTLYIPAGSKAAYQSAVQWQDFPNMVEMQRISVAPASLMIGPVSGSSGSVAVTANTAWTAVSEKSWLNVNLPSGNGNAKVILTAEANPENLSRSAKVTFKSGISDSVSVIVTQEIKSPQSTIIGMNSGWNIISTGRIPQDPDIQTLFHSPILNGSLVKIQDENGNSLEDLGLLGGWVNNIGKITPSEGYKVKVNRYTEILISGSEIPMPYKIPLKGGWNITGFPKLSEADAMAVIQQLINRGTMVKVQDEKGNSIEDMGGFGGWQNNIGKFVPGKGYKIKVNTTDTLKIYDSY